jgi:hypothetical protein
MPNFKSLTDDQLWWKSQPGNRGKDVPSPEEAKAAYGRYGRQANKNVDTVSSGLDSIRKFIFRDSDARKQPIEDAVNNGDVVDTPYGKQRMTKDAQREALEKPVTLPKRINPRMAPPEIDKRGAVDLKQKSVLEDKPQYEDDDIDADTMSQGQTVKRGGTIKKYANGGKISLNDCKVSTHQKSKKQSNW